MHPYFPNYDKLFDKAYDIVSKYEFAHERPDKDYEYEKADWEYNNKPNPKKFMLKLCDPYHVLDNGLRYHRIAEVNDYISENNPLSKYEIKRSKDCMQEIKNL